MGCVSSKILTKSRSFREELSLSLKRRTNGFSALNDLIGSKNDGDQLLALFVAANATKNHDHDKIADAENHHAGSGDRSEDPTTVAAETIDARELMDGLDDEEEEDGGRRQQRERPSEGEDRPEKFHTVEEYDALVLAGSCGETAEVSLECGAAVAGDGGPAEEEEVDAEKKQLHADSSVGSEAVVASTATTAASSVIKDVDCLPESSRTPTAGECDTTRETQHGRRDPRRRRLAPEGLRPVELPSFDFSRAGSLKEWLGAGGQVFSPGSYVTPRFGGLAGEEAPAGGGERGAFLPELVADLEEAMERLTAEEEQVLRQIVGV